MFRAAPRPRPGMANDGQISTAIDAIQWVAGKETRYIAVSKANRHSALVEQGAESAVVFIDQHSDLKNGLLSISPYRSGKKTLVGVVKR
jgi:hypothetical protein